MEAPIDATTYLFSSSSENHQIECKLVVVDIDPGYFRTDDHVLHHEKVWNQVATIREGKKGSGEERGVAS